MGFGFNFFGVLPVGHRQGSIVAVEQERLVLVAKSEAVQRSHQTIESEHLDMH